MHDLHGRCENVKDMRSFHSTMTKCPGTQPSNINLQQIDASIKHFRLPRTCPPRKRISKKEISENHLFSGRRERERESTFDWAGKTENVINEMFEVEN